MEAKVMEVDLKQIRAAAEEKRLNPSYLQQLKEELKKVSWTTKTELLFCTKVVVIATFAFGIGIYLVDLFMKGALELVKAIVQFAFG